MAKDEKIKKNIIKKEKSAEKPAEKIPFDEMDLKGQNDANSQKDFTPLLQQIESEYTLAYWFMKPKWTEWGLRLKLYNNQKRDKSAVGDPLLFTIFNTVLASLYDDRLMSTFLPRENGDTDVAENLNDLADYDYDEMGKDIVDYNWDWDTLFFGRGLVMLMEFDRGLMCPSPENWDPMTTLRDPRAKSVNGDMKGRGKARFLGREVRMSKQDMKDAKVYFNIDKLKVDSTDLNSLVDQNQALRQEAQGYSDVQRFDGNLLGDTATYRLIEWFTRHKGKLVYVTAGNNRKTIVRYQEIKSNRIPIVDRSLYPIAGDWDGVSICDLTEDKQRARAKLTNLGLKVAEAGLYPSYLFDSTRIKNKADLNFDMNKFIGVEGNPTGAIQEVPKSAIKTDVDYIMKTLDMAAQKATATPDIQQGTIGGDNRTATEVSIAVNKVDTRYSLSAKIFGWSEKRFWQMWYSLYKVHFIAGIDEKIIRISGTFGATFRPLRRENIIAVVDPDVKVESKVIADAKRFNLLQQFRAYLQSLVGIPTANIRFGLKYMGQLSGLKKDVINTLIPPTIDEMIAEEENKGLERNEIVTVKVTDDHYMHLEIHNKLSETPAKYAHIQAHKKAMMLLKENPNIIPPQQSGINPIPQGGSIADNKALPTPERTSAATGAK